MDNGLFITFEGIDGCGKSSLLQALAEHWKYNSTIVTTKEPGGSELGKHLRALLQEQPVALNPQAEFLLFAADRSQHFSTVVLPALQQGALVLSDRCADSSVAYQGYGGSLSIEMIQTVNAWAMHNRQPDITIYVRTSREIALQRCSSRNEKLTAFELRGSDFWNKVTLGFDTLFTGNPRAIIVDGNQPREALIKDTLMAIARHLHNSPWHTKLFTPINKEHTAQL